MRQSSVSSPLTEFEVTLVERELGVSFPTEYRACLQEEAPAQQVFRPRRVGSGWDWGFDWYWPAELVRLPFPHPDSYARAEHELAAREPLPEDFTDVRAHIAAYDAWDQEYEVFQYAKIAGAVLLQENGCGFSTLLAVSGPLAGTVWWDGRASCDLILPLSLDHPGGARPVTFGEWLRHGSWHLLPPNRGRTDAE
ncbi:SMI1/KNR4 family protein [Streptomyces sp. NPDC001568]|uniref:SMI1/KNR4 family protein n=1 Tax=Streptomyces sp. NPDC001568 TaxID=3364588 RepID=UPI003682DA22